MYHRIIVFLSALSLHLVRLRHISDSNAKGSDGLSIADRMEERVQTIAKDIKECGSACDVYLKKGFLGIFRHLNIL